MKYKTKPIIVEARQFTLEAATGMFEFENWCNGSVKGTMLSPSERIVEVHAGNGDYFTAEVGDWVVKQLGYFKVFSDVNFKKLYEVVE